MSRACDAAILVFSMATVVSAQDAYLVKDINTIASADAQSSNPVYFAELGARRFFIASSRVPLTELWTTDGTAGGTTKIADVGNAGISVPPRFAVVNGRLVFNARDSRGEELWVTDGTTGGTHLVADISPGSAGSSPGDRIVFGNMMFFGAEDFVSGRELWVTDGTTDGTKLFKDLISGPRSSDPKSFVLFNNLIYFSAGGALWKSDGTPDGTVVVKPSVNVTSLTVAGGHLFFVGYTPEMGSEPWVSDGTEGGTHLIMEIQPGTVSSVLPGFATLGDRVLFVAEVPPKLVADRRLWISDGTAAGTVVLSGGIALNVDVSSFTPLGDLMFFTARVGNAALGLWKTDGTDAGTMVVPDTTGRTPRSLIASAGKIYYAASSGSIVTLWTTDGTANGTRPVKTTDPIPAVSLLGSMFAASDGAVYFSGSNALNGFEPWKSDGTDAGTFMIANLAQDPVPSSSPDHLTAAGDWIYFDAWDGVGTVTSGAGGPRSLWRSDGTPEGTLKLADSPVIPYVAAGRSVFFVKTGDGRWRSDGTPEGTFTANGFLSRFPGPASVAFVLGEKVFVTVEGSGLWVTTMAPDAAAVPLGVSGGIDFVDVAGRAFYVGGGIWTTDGTPAGSHQVIDPDGRISDPPVVMGGEIYFVTQSFDATKLWKTEGTFEGSVVVKTLSTSASLRATERHVFFLEGRQLFVTDGTEAGTHALTSPLPLMMAAAGDRLVFTASDPAGGISLWVSDGTADGTHVVPGVSSTLTPDFLGAGGLVYFTGSDAVHGAEVWTSDGTTEGTRLVADVAPGPDSSFPKHYVRAGERIYFTASTAATGNELWAMARPTTPRLRINDTRVTEGDSGLTTARFSVTLATASSQDVSVDFATADGSAIAGPDYDSTSGTVHFAPGETSKEVDVAVRGNTTPENNRVFFVTLRNASGASLEKSGGFAVIDDDDQIADVALALDFSSFDSLSVFSNATNNGPRAATGLKIEHTATPTDTSVPCNSCPRIPPQLPSGATARAFEYRWFGSQQYLTATVRAFERDPQPGNNSVAWMTNGVVAMDALYLTPGSQANIWLNAQKNIASVSVESSDPSIVSVPSAVGLTRIPMNFTAQGLRVGTATIRVFTSAQTIGTLKIDVVTPGTKLRYPGALNVAFSDFITVRFDQAVAFRIVSAATAPYSGETATGLVTITSRGKELGRLTMTHGADVRNLSVLLPDSGTQQLTVTYAGDANFLPSTQTFTATASPGFVTLTAVPERIGGVTTIHVAVAGSIMAAPSGTIALSESGVIPQTQPVTLHDSGAGVARADIMLTGLSAGTHTFAIAYSGDSHYKPLTQNVRVTDPRKPSVRH